MLPKNDIKHVYFFGNHEAEGNVTMKNLLGGKGANLAEMDRFGIPVPPGFTITTDICKIYNKIGGKNTIKVIIDEIEEAVNRVEGVMGSKFGDVNNPLLLSARSGARVSMPGMMDTVLNLGLNDATVEGLAKKSKNERFAWDSYRRFIQMYGGVVMGMKPEAKEDHDPFEVILDKIKDDRGVDDDTKLTADDLREVVQGFKDIIIKRKGMPFPEDPWDQLRGVILAIFDSWNTDRAIYYRRMNDIPEDWGTAVNVQGMVYGNMGDNSATGVAFTRDAATGENLFNGEYLLNAQGEDVVAGVRTPRQITKTGSQRWAVLAGVPEEERVSDFPSLEEVMPEVYQQLYVLQNKLEDHYREMQDLEFTIQEGRLWILQTRSGKRTGAAMVRIAMEMLDAGIITEQEALLRIEPNKLDELLHPIFKPEAILEAHVIAKGLPASPGAATGQVVFFADDAVAHAEQGKRVILVRTETSPEDLAGMNNAQGILTARGGMTSHAAVVARGMGKCCVSGAGKIRIDYHEKTLSSNGDTFREGDWISINGTTGEVYEGKIDTIKPKVSGHFATLMQVADAHSRMYIKANADTPHDAQVARDFGAKGIGLCRTEHMFFEGEKIIAMREMILAKDATGRKDALAKLLPIQRKDFEELFAVMHDLPVTVRLLDPPLHEFVPQDEEGQKEMAEVMNVDLEVIRNKVESLSETNPMLGHRGCRLGNTYPEITEMQTRAILEAALNLKKRGIRAVPEIMIPLTGIVTEMKLQEIIVRKVANKIFEEYGDTLEYKVGTMIEIPRAVIAADRIAKSAEFFSFGTNDLTQMTFGYSRDDAAKFIPIYLEKGLLHHDPFEVLDQEGVGELMKVAIKKGRKTRPNMPIGICGEHGGEPSSVEFCNLIGTDYASCSPYRVPIARVAAAQGEVKRLIAKEEAERIKREKALQIRKKFQIKN
jgi:pyruvate,orthophosphate dikinase